MKNEGDIRELQTRIAKWADSVFPNRTPFGAAAKLVMEEIPEWLQNPKDPLEYADLVILILDIASLNGVDVKQAVLDKMSINERRRWEINPDTGLMRHLD